MVLDNQEEGASAGVVAMSGDGTNDVYIPSVFLNTVSAPAFVCAFLFSVTYRRDDLLLTICSIRVLFHRFSPW